jgi:hypothetical protein
MTAAHPESNVQARNRSASKSLNAAFIPCCSASQLHICKLISNSLRRKKQLAGTLSGGRCSRSAVA